MGVAWLVQSSAEEILFRGFLLQSFGSRGLVGLGVAVQAVVFAIAHIGAWTAPLALVNLALFAIFAALLTIRSGSLWVAIGLHIAWNFALGNGVGLTVSQNSIPGGSLLPLEVFGPSWVTGGKFGVEGSLLCTAVWGMALLAVALTWRRYPTDS